MWGVACGVEGLEIQSIGPSSVVMLTSCTPVIAGLVICTRNVYKYTYVYIYTYVIYIYIYTYVFLLYINGL